MEREHATEGAEVKNQLYYGDNLDVLREDIADASIDLVYLDPPFNSNRSYNVLFQSHAGQDAEAQIQAVRLGHRRSPAHMLTLLVAKYEAFDIARVRVIHTMVEVNS
jgi:16S rRNA G966 N2-methylase RsmD